MKSNLETFWIFKNGTKHVQLQIFIQANITMGKKLRTWQGQPHLVSGHFIKVFYKTTTCSKWPHFSWSHLVVLNMGLLDWESSALTTRPLLHKGYYWFAVLKQTNNIVWFLAHLFDFSPSVVHLMLFPLFFIMQKRYVIQICISKVKIKTPKEWKLKIFLFLNKTILGG